MKKTILTNISFNFLIRAATYFFSFLTLLYVTRVLQPESFGRISFASSFTGYFVLLANLGMPIYAIRACSEKRDDQADLIRTFNELWSIDVVLSFASIVLLSLTVMMIPKLRENALLFSVYGSTILFQMLGCEWMFRGLEKFRFLAISSLVCKTVSFVCILLFVRSEQSVITYAVLSVFAGYGSNIICFFMLRKKVNISFSIHLNMKHFRPLLVFFAMSCAVSIYSSLDLTMLGFMDTEYATGLYSVAAKGRNALTMTGGIVWGAILPTATKLWNEGKRHRFETLAAKSLVIVSTIQISAAVICIILAKQMILLAGGSSYLGAVSAFRILMLSLFPVGASNILGGQVLIPSGNEKRLLEAEITGAAFNFTANLILIPLLSIEGAAITTVISEIIVCILCLLFIKKDMGMDMVRVAALKTAEKAKQLCRTAAVKAESRIKKDHLPYYCPCCSTYLTEFVDGGFDKKPDKYNPLRYRNMDHFVICPVCHSLPRHRILVSWMNDNTDKIHGKRILHFAQEKSIRIWMQRNQIKSMSADLYQPADLKLNIEETGLDDASFDIIICNHVLEHVTDYKKALQELGRILRPGGILIISFPMDLSLETVYEDDSILTKEDRITHFGQCDHLRIFGRNTPEILKSAGFSVTEIRGDDYGQEIKPTTGPADYDLNVLYCLTK